MKKGIKKDNIFLRRCPRLTNIGRGKFCYALAVCLLLTVFLFVNTVITHASGASLSAADNTSGDAAVFPQLFCSDPIYYAQTDNIIAASDAAAVNYFYFSRGLYGLNNPEMSGGLSRAALYGAFAALCAERGTETGSAVVERGTETGSAGDGFAPVGGLGGTFPDISGIFSEIDAIDGFACVVFDDFTCLNAEKSAKLTVDSLLDFSPLSRDLPAIKFSEIKAFGLASAIRQTASGCIYCAVICVSYDPIGGSEDNYVQGLFPDILCISGEFNEFPKTGTTFPDISENQNGSLSPVPLPASDNQILYFDDLSAINSESIAEASGIVNLRGEPVGVNLNRADIDRLRAGDSQLNISMTFGGRIAGNTVDVAISSPSSVGTEGKTIVLPSIPESELWNVIRYIDFPALTTSKPILCSPLAIGVDDMAEPVSGPRFTQATIIEEGRDGNYSQTSIALEYAGIELSLVRPMYTDNKGLNVHIGQGSTLSEDGHSIISWLGDETGLTDIELPEIELPETGENGSLAPGQTVENGSLAPVQAVENVSLTPVSQAEPYYVFTIESPDGTVQAVRKNDPYLVWNPAKEGTTTLSAGRYDALGRLAGSATIIINVAKKVEMVYSEPVLELTAGELPGSISITETGDGNKLIRGIHAGTTAEALTAIFVVSGGAEPELTITKPDGTAIAGDAKVGTGAVIRVADRGKVYYELYAVITGDVNGDGAVGIADFAKLRQHLLNGDVVNGFYVYAADLNGDDAIGVADFAKLRQYLLGALELD